DLTCGTLIPAYHPSITTYRAILPLYDYSCHWEIDYIGTISTGITISPSDGVRHTRSAYSPFKDGFITHHDSVNFNLFGWGERSWQVTVSGSPTYTIT